MDNFFRDALCLSDAVSEAFEKVSNGYLTRHFGANMEEDEDQQQQQQQQQQQCDDNIRIGTSADDDLAHVHNKPRPKAMDLLGQSFDAASMPSHQQHQHQHQQQKSSTTFRPTFLVSTPRRSSWAPSLDIGNPDDMSPPLATERSRWRRVTWAGDEEDQQQYQHEPRNHHHHQGKPATMAATYLLQRNNRREEQVEGEEARESAYYRPALCSIQTMTSPSLLNTTTRDKRRDAVRVSGNINNNNNLVSIDDGEDSDDGDIIIGRSSSSGSSSSAASSPLVPVAATTALSFADVSKMYSKQLELQYSGMGRCSMIFVHVERHHDPTLCWWALLNCVRPGDSVVFLHVASDWLRTPKAQKMTSRDAFRWLRLTQEKVKREYGETMQDVLRHCEHHGIRATIQLSCGPLEGVFKRALMEDRPGLLVMGHEGGTQLRGLLSQWKGINVIRFGEQSPIPTNVKGINHRCIAIAAHPRTIFNVYKFLGQQMLQQGDFIYFFHVTKHANEKEHENRIRGVINRLMDPATLRIGVRTSGYKIWFLSCGKIGEALVQAARDLQPAFLAVGDDTGDRLRDVRKMLPGQHHIKYHVLKHSPCPVVIAK